ncbi:MAG: aminopeptidase P family protein [Planctomycetaceae bacterium]|nr:aminopeptidase P family protein [Planctomycetaceae bacterium]
MSTPRYAQRRNKLLREIKAAGAAGMLVTAVSNVRYLTGFTGDSSWLLLSPSTTRLFSDTRYETQLATECPDLDVEIRDSGMTMNAAVSAAIAKIGLRNLAFEPDRMTVGQLTGLQKATEGVDWLPLPAAVEQLREVKDKWELAEIRAAVRMAERGIAVTRASLVPEQSERDVRYLLEAAMRSFGANGPAFEPIIGVGPTGALPHAHAGQLRVSESPALLIDWGAETPSGYRSDITRVLFTAKPTALMRKVYQTVLDAQKAAIEAIRPGALCCDVDRIARSAIENAGYGKYFGHGLGHGFGLEIHESVRLSPLSQQVLEPGMVVTVEPGIYLAGQFGVRIEDDVLVTADGYEVLTSVPKELEEVILDS